MLSNSELTHAYPNLQTSHELCTKYHRFSLICSLTHHVFPLFSPRPPRSISHFLFACHHPFVPPPPSPPRPPFSIACHHSPPTYPFTLPPTQFLITLQVLSQTSASGFSSILGSIGCESDNITFSTQQASKPELGGTQGRVWGGEMGFAACSTQ